MKRNKIKTQAEIKSLIGKKKEEGKVIGFTNGCFDILHPGHIRYLDAAKEECDILIIGVNSDDSVRGIKGKTRPINPEEDRLEVLGALESVDYLTLFSEDTPENLIADLTPDILFKGGDWKEDEIAGAAHVKSKGGRVRIITYEKGYSTTRTIEKMTRSVDGE
ncbi:MAG: D-glycero-beta-D-manno-heptose 1-phosphate adenylyltransferase [Candidatus Omnitrophota bacterium]